MNATFWMNLLQQVLMVVVPLLAVAMFGWISAFVVKEWKTILTKYPQQATKWEDVLRQFSPVFVAGAEQMRKAGLLPTGAQAKAWVIQALQNYLNSKGFGCINVDLIEAVTEKDVAKLPPFEVNSVGLTGTKVGTLTFSENLASQSTSTQNTSTSAQ
jgi:hypothetical protein